MKRYLIVSVTIAMVFGFHPTITNAENLVGSNVDYRLIVALRVKQAAVQSWIPNPWQVTPVAKGPLKDANLYVVFVDRLLNQDAEGKTNLGGTFRVVAIVAPAKHSQTEQLAPFVLRVFTPHKDISLYNAYKNTIRADISCERTLKSTNLEPGIGTELWEVKDDSGGVMTLRMNYQRSIPSRANRELKPRSAIEPDFFRIYRFDQGSDLIKSVSMGLNRAQNFEFKVTLSDFRKMFDGSEEVIGIVSVPWYVRKLFLP